MEIALAAKPYLENIMFYRLAGNLGKMDPDAVDKFIMPNIKAAVDLVHYFTISRKGTYFRTRMPKKGNSYPEMKAKSENELYKKLYSFYYSNLDNPTLTELFEEWIADKEASIRGGGDDVSRHNTLTRHRQHYAKYFRATPLFAKRISQITSDMLSQFCLDTIRSHNLSQKEWTNAKTILKGMFSFAAHKRHYISVDPFTGVYLNGVRFRQVKAKAQRDAVFTKRELVSLKTWLYDDFKTSHDMADLAVLFVIETGLRAAECLSLSWADVHTEYIVVSSQLLTDAKTGALTVATYTKANRIREVYLTDDAKRALDVARSGKRRDTELVFHRSGRIITERACNYKLEKYAVKHKVPVRRMHSLRFTYASILGNEHVPPALIQEMMGHSDLKMTLHYVKRFTDKTETQNIINDAFKSVSH